tara:strand:+ start:184 stop:378 length:195 start_codon:yes stop_codon:yes gene_type:complete
MERFNFEVAKRGRYSNYPPYGVGVLATHLRRDAIMGQLDNSWLPEELYQEELASAQMVQQSARH